MSEQNAVEINMVDMFRMILSRWRGLILGAVIGGCLLGAFTLARNYRSMTDTSKIARRRAEYESDMEIYEVSREQIETQIENLKAGLENQQFIEEHNLLFQIDPYNVYVESLSFYVDTGYEIQPELVYQNLDRTATVANSYRTVLKRIDLRGLFENMYGEKIMLDNPVKGNSFVVINAWTEAENGMLYVLISADCRENANIIADAVTQTIEEASEKFQTVYGEHTITEFQHSEYQTINMDLANMMDTFNSNTESIQKALEDARTELDGLKPPVLEQSGLRALAKKAIRYGVIGAAAGFFAAVVWLGLRFALLDRMWNLSDVRRRYDVAVLGTFPGKCRSLGTRLDRMLAGKFGVTVWKESGKAAAYLKERMRLELGENAVVLVGSGTAPAILEGLCTALKEADTNTIFTVAGDLESSAEAVASVANAKAVVLVEPWRKTPHRVLREELETVWRVVPKEKTAVIAVL